MSASEARRGLFSLIKRVNDDHTPVRISPKGGDAVIMSADDHEAWQETVHLLRRLVHRADDKEDPRGSLRLPRPTCGRGPYPERHPPPGSGPPGVRR
ncbi:type II toxin-antitoxin system Phd/YefM family antitoxin [Streptomyces bobili]|uniref:type II toxin-antitoxin system Phd/YefM family antitoxin n=1 Tax=Streptomyces bobili TaxID=67280 RepID=UPI003F53FA10